jgi:uncharacterized protein DUF4440
MAARTAATVFLLIALAACEKRSDKRVTESIEQAIRQLDNERIQAQIGADRLALDLIYANDFIGVGPSGTVRTKPQVISDFTSGDLKFQCWSEPPPAMQSHFKMTKTVSAVATLALSRDRSAMSR